MIKEREFKLIKEYPGSPPLNCIIKYTGNEWMDPYPNEEHDNGVWLQDVLKHPLFWEEIKPKGWEITALKYNKSIYRYQDKIYKNRFHKEEYASPYVTIDGLYEDQDESYKISIYSVKRLYDNKEFKIGDKVLNREPKSHLHKDQTIISFIINGENNICAITDLTNDNGLSITKLELAEELLFTTDDNVDIYHGDSYWYVKPENNYSITKSIAYKGLNSSRKIEGILDFSTKKAAEEYVIENKPFLSLKDIDDCYSYPKGSRLYNNLKTNLIETIKIKLKQ